MAADLPTHIGRYEVVSRLGQGGMGSLYLAKDPKIGRLVAIKLVRQEFDSPEARHRFAREAQSAGALRHPNIVTIFDVDEHDGLPYIAMEYIDGETLAEVVKRKALLPLTRRLQWMEDLCQGLAYAHRQGVVHRDIKPANLMVDTEGTLKILDFGLARRDQSKFTQSHVLVGTPNYMSPEQIRGENIDTRSDIFSVGSVAYEVIAYREAFPGAVHQTMHRILHEEPEPLDHLVPGIDRELAKIVSRALQKDRDGRYQDLLAMRQDLAAVRQRMESATQDAGVTSPMPKDARFDVPGAGTGAASPSPRGATPSSSRSSGSSKRAVTNRQSLHRRRAEQISTLLDDARRKFEAGTLEAAREACEHALLFDPDHPGGLQLMEDIAAEIDRRQVAQWLGEARAELQKGQLDRAEALVAQARQLTPDFVDVHQLQEAIDTARREIERTRQIQEAMRRARARFAEGSFDGAIRAAGEVLAIDGENAAALDLRARAQEALQAQATRGERDAAAQAAVSAARKRFEGGDAAGAITELEQFSPPHDVVSAFLATLRGEGPFARGGETAHILRGARGPSPDLPARRNFRIAVSVFFVLVVSAVLYYRPWARPEAVPANVSEAVPAAQGAEPSAENVSPPAPITPPATLTGAPPTDQNGSDLIRAYEAFNSNRVDEAQRIAAQIRRRDPQYQGLAALFTAVANRRAEEDKQRQAAATAAASSPTAAPTRPAPPEFRDPDAPPASSATSPLTVLPGGGFAASSELPPPLLVGQVERPAIEKVVQAWASALATRDTAAISRVRTLTQQEANNWRRLFEPMRAYKLNARVVADPVVAPTGLEATAQVEEIVQSVDRRGIEITQNPRTVTYRFRKIGGEWRLLPP